MEKFTFKETGIDGLIIVEPTLHTDKRGFFYESYNKIVFEENGFFYDFIQDNHSLSKKGVIRGLHFQIKHPQAKLVRIIKGEVFDVVVDLRQNSKTFGKWFGVLLTSENKKQLLIPRGFAHGFAVISDIAEFVYKCDNLYMPEDESGIAFNDPNINIKWPAFDEIFTSKKDAEYPCFDKSKKYFGGKL